MQSVFDALRLLRLLPFVNISSLLPPRKRVFIKTPTLAYLAIILVFAPLALGCGYVVMSGWNQLDRPWHSGVWLFMLANALLALSMLVSSLLGFLSLRPWGLLLTEEGMTLFHFLFKKSYSWSHIHGFQPDVPFRTGGVVSFLTNSIPVRVLNEGAPPLRQNGILQAWQAFSDKPFWLPRAINFRHDYNKPKAVGLLLPLTSEETAAVLNQWQEYYGQGKEHRTNPG